MKHFRLTLILSTLWLACAPNWEAPINSPSTPDQPCGLNADSCGSHRCCDRPYQCSTNGTCTYSGGGNSGDYFGARKSVPQRPEAKP